MLVRPEAPADRAVVRRIHLASFPGPGEADLVDRLRADGDAVYMLVAETGGAAVGHIVFSAMTAPFPALGLGPVAVLPEHRRQGVAAALIEDGKRRALGDGWQGIFVLGDPGYYERFGFRHAHAAGFDCVYACEHFLALPLVGGALPVPTGAVAYPPAFADLG